MLFICINSCARLFVTITELTEIGFLQVLTGKGTAYKRCHCYSYTKLRISECTFLFIICHSLPFLNGYGILKHVFLYLRKPFLVLSLTYTLYFYSFFVEVGYIGNTTNISCPSLYEAARHAQPLKNVGTFTGISVLEVHMRVQWDCQVLTDQFYSLSA